MNTPKAILIGFALVAAAVYFSRDVGPAQAAIGSANYSMAVIDGKMNTAFILNNNTGELKYCAATFDMKKMVDKNYCQPWFGR